MTVAWGRQRHGGASVSDGASVSGGRLGILQASRSPEHDVSLGFARNRLDRLGISRGHARGEDKVSGGSHQIFVAHIGACAIEYQAP
jgi:hypothetical protein